MTHEEAMALLVMTRALTYARREAALCAAGGPLSLVSEPQAYAAQLGMQGVSALRETVRRAPRLLESLAQDGVHLIARGGAGYPACLAQTHRPPHLLFAKGRPDVADRFPVAIVGTRRASEYGVRHTRAIAAELARAGVCVVSGLALGIDAQAHRGALSAGGRTVAVLGGALDRFYPEENRPLMEQILGSGGTVVTEYAPGTPPGRYSFLERNRIIAGLSLGVVVTEGGRRSGAQRTVREALEEGREVFALPGSVDSENAALPNSLIAEGAHLITCGADVLRMLVIEPGQTPAEAEKERPVRARETRHGDAEPERQEADSAQAGLTAGAALTVKPAPGPSRETPKDAARTPPEGLDAPARAVFDALCGGEMDFDALCERTGIPSQELGALLTLMELDGLVVCRAGLNYALA